MKTKQLALASVIGLSGFALHCGSNDADCNETRTCAVTPGGDAGPDNTAGGDGGPAVPPGCDASADVKDAPKCVVNEFGVFVDAASGNDGNSGTKELPMKTIGGALGKLGGKTRVYVCEGTYAESVKLTSAVSIYGGFACGTWSHSGVAAKVAPGARGVPLSIANASSAVVVSDLDVTAQDASDPGESSIAMFVASSTKVTLRRVKATAGKGSDGKDAVDAADFTPAAAPDGTGGTTGGAQTANPACATSIGGAGGKDGATSGASGKVAIVPEFPTGNTGAGGAFTNGASCATGLGTDGSYGAAGGAGAGAAKVGTLSAQGWKGADGAGGGKGGDGQGGGGGGQRNAGGVGGSGGPGGCGGAGGGSGTGGGSSIALAVFEASVLLETTTLGAKDGGRGGNGGKGQKGQLGSQNAGAPSSGTDACAGGVGGIGGSGGGGGGGAGGVSAGIVYKGTAPVIEGVATPTADTHASVTLGQKGAAGTKGAGGDAARTNAPASRAGDEGTDGVAGEAKAVMSVQ